MWSIRREVWNRDEVYRDVWSKPLTLLVEKYGISAVAIAKNCRKWRIPLPGRGYWAKKAHGHSLHQTPLPPLQQSQSFFWYQPVAQPAEPGFPEILEDKAECDRIDQLLCSGALTVHPSSKALSHRLIVATRRRLYGAKQPEGFEPTVDVRVSRLSANRAISIMATLFAAFESQCATISVEISNDYGQPWSKATHVTFFGERVAFELVEKCRRVRTPEAPKPNSAQTTLYQARQQELEPTGVLWLNVTTYSRFFKCSWRDGKKRRLEDQLSESVAAIMKIALERRRASIKAQEERRRREARREELMKLKVAIEVEEARLAELVEHSEAWKRAKGIREFVPAWVDAQRRYGKECGPDSPVESWARWALDQADRIDPLSQSPGSVIDRRAELKELTPAWS